MDQSNQLQLDFLPTDQGINHSEALLKPHERLRVLSHIQRLELRDYRQMRDRGLPTRAHWQQIRSNCVTNLLTTIWQLSTRYWHKFSDAIGNEEPPLALIDWILDESPQQ